MTQDRPTDSTFDQSPYRLRLDWGRRGAIAAAARGDVVVVVDVLSFSTAAIAAVEAGAIVIPCDPACDQRALAAELGAELAVKRDLVPAGGRYSLSPSTFADIEPGTRVLVPSPNGASCAAAAAAAPEAAVLIGSLNNLLAVARTAMRLCPPDGTITVIAAGERWPDPDDDGRLRFAIEDYLGAGAILALLHDGPYSPEAQLCARAYGACEHDVPGFLWDCASGRELRARGYGEDVRFAARRGTSNVVPVLRDGCLVPA
ncbi:MAG TPA: 2-phosphosulfolactate phosphatase [bacterium]|nr:2-phosphosulfolactate phosphatase [bacterium]